MPNNFHELPIVDIVIGERFRKDYGDIAELAQSIKDYGLLQPLVVARDGRLMAGGRRLAAVTALAWPTVPVHYIDEVDNILLREIELEENLLREDLSTQEEATLRLEIHELKVAKYGQANSTSHEKLDLDIDAPIAETAAAAGWSIRRTAELTGANPATVHQQLRIGKALRSPEIVAMAPSIKTEPSRVNIIRILDRLEEDLLREKERRQRDADTYARLESSVLCGDATSLILQLPDASVDCIITDPPYGVNLGVGGGHRSGGALNSPEEGFDDSPESMLAVLRSLAPQLRRVLKPAGHLYAFFSPKFWQPIFDIWRRAGFDVRDIPCIWVKPGGATGTNDWDHNFAATWEPFLFASPSVQRLAFKRRDTFVYAVDLGASRLHAAQKPVELLRELVQLSTREGELILDPFCGSGSTLVAASQLRRRFLGYDLSTHHCNTAIKRLFDEGKERPYVIQQSVA